MRTTRAIKPREVEKKWLLVDAKGLIVGRAAAEIARVLRGKHKPSFTPHVDCGDNVIVINAEKVCLTGRKREQKVYYRHTGHAGGLKRTTAGEVLAGPHPERVLEKAIERMIPRGPLGRQQMRNLRIYSGPEHPHQAQSPELFDVASLNRKNAIAQQYGGSKSNQAGAHKPGRSGSGIVEREWSSFDALDRLLLLLDNPEPRIRTDALQQLADILPVPEEELSAITRANVVKLRALSMRLLRAVLENAKTPEAARNAAIALVKVAFPQHYRDRDPAELEQRAFGDLQRIVRHHDLHYFCTFDARRGPRGTAQVEAFVWSSFPFKLDGRMPALSPADWVDPGEGLSMKVIGAELLESESVQREELAKGQILGCAGELALDAEQHPDKIVIYLYNGPRLIEEQVYPATHLFKGYSRAPRDGVS